jgi:G3E family GTPase
MRITLITGFLGAGKTTFLRRFLSDHFAVSKMGVIVNDLSPLEVDGELIRGSDVVSEEEGTLVSIHAGSISGERRPEFQAALNKMQESGIEHLIIETSGSTEPRVVIAEIQAAKVGTLHAVATLVDARMLLHDYEGGLTLLAHLSNTPETVTAEGLLIEQLRVASVIVITKLDIIREDQLTPLLRSIQAINPDATLVGCAHGKIEPSVILQALPYAQKFEPSTAATRVSEIQSLVIRDLRPLHPQRFFDLYQQRLGVGLFRSKGFIWFVSRPGHLLLWNQAGGSMGLEFLATWRGYVLEHDARLFPEEKALLRTQLDAMHPLYGDRSCELTLIGHARDLSIFGKELMDCFCTEDELAHWQNGGSFPDPWPANLKIMR